MLARMIDPTPLEKPLSVFAQDFTIPPFSGICFGGLQLKFGETRRSSACLSKATCQSAFMLKCEWVS